MNERIPTTPGGFQVVYADPPWTYNDKAAAGKRGVAFKYPLMTMLELRSMPVVTRAADDSVLFMWATMPLLPDAIKLMPAWGFEYKTVAFVWVKTNRSADTDFFGMGNWTRCNAEVVLLGVRGRPKRVDCGVRQVVRSPILRHSEKPPEVRARIERLMGPARRVELFSRHEIPGWARHGNELLPKP